VQRRILEHKLEVIGLVWIAVLVHPSEKELNYEIYFTQISNLLFEQSC
jgi:hypothetical protein